MKIKTITVSSQRVKNLGNFFKSEQLEITAEVEGNDEAYVALLKNKIWELLSNSLNDDEGEDEEDHWNEL